ncbi:MAG: hypothetical protein IV088_21095 [Hydrogenophaga sp.]|nr:hypothetical protein [Hydrogenophaga sp.]
MPKLPEVSKLTLRPIQYRLEAEISGPSKIVIESHCQQSSVGWPSLAFEALSNVDGQTLPCEQIDHRQRPQLKPIEQRISDEVRAPDFVHGVRQLLGLTQLCCLVAPIADAPG